jgi:endonuclease/exonuclease/phosphatase family metal-dependent hydrolase
MPVLTDLTVWSYNVLAERYAGDTARPWTDRLSRLISKIAALDADVVFLQEIELATAEADFVSALAIIGFEGFTHIHSLKKGGRSNPIGNAVFWRTGDFFATDFWRNSTAIGVTLTKDGHSMGLANIHLKAGIETGVAERVKQLRSTLRHLPPGNVFIGGDWNDDLVPGPVLDLLSGFHVCRVEKSCWVRERWFGFDHAAVRGGVVVAACEVVVGHIPRDGHDSDHLPVTFLSTFGGGEHA